MKSQREIERKYNKMLESHKELVAPNRVNCYVCNHCGYITKTIDVDKGVTPFMHNCEKCNGLARSTFYQDIAPNQKPTQEWFRPTLKQALKMKRNEDMLDHLFGGGLDVRTIKTES